MGMALRSRPTLVLAVVVLAVTVLVALPVRAHACELLNQLLVGCAPPGPTPGSPAVPVPPLEELPGVITLPSSPQAPAVPAVPKPTLPPLPGGRPVLVPEAARHLLDLANAERAAVGAQPLTMRSDVSKVAAGHSLAMAERGAIWHNAAYVTDAVADLLQATWVRGENVAWSDDVDHAHRLLMESPAHRMNLLDPRYSVAGFAVARSADGNYWVTQNFLQPLSSPAPNRPAAPGPAGSAPTLESVSAPGPRSPSASMAAVVPPTVDSDRAPEGLVDARADVALAEPEHLSGAVLAAEAATTGAPPARLAALAAALVVLVALGHGVSWRAVRS